MFGSQSQVYSVLPKPVVMYSSNFQRNVKDYGAQGDNLSDDTLAIQNCINDCSKDGSYPGLNVFFPPGIYRVNGRLKLYPSSKLVGSSVTCNVDESAIGKLGVQIVGYGSGESLMYTATLVDHPNLEIRNLTLRAHATSNYTWVLHTHNMRSSFLDDCIFQQDKDDGSNHNVYFQHDKYDEHKFDTLWSWINNVTKCYFSSKPNGGYNMRSQSTDSRFSNNYFSGGWGVLEEGSDNIYTTCMFDLARVTGLTFENFAIVNTIVSCNFQLCGVSCISVSNATPKTFNITITGCNFNMSNSSVAQLYLGNAKYVTVTGCVFDESNTPASVLMQGVCTKCVLAGNICPKGLPTATEFPTCTFSGNVS